MTDKKEAQSDERAAKRAGRVIGWLKLIAPWLFGIALVAALSYMVGGIAWMEQNRQQRRIDDCKAEGLITVEALDGTKTCVDGWHAHGDGSQLAERTADIKACRKLGGEPVQSAVSRWTVVCVEHMGEEALVR